MNSINNNGNVSFNARMNVSKMKVDKARWNNIAKIFEEKTKNNRAGECVFELSSRKGKGGAVVDSMDYISDGGIIEGKIYDKLMKLSDEQIAGKFKKLLTLVTKPRDEGNKFANKIEKYALEEYKDIDVDVFDAVETTLKKESYNKLGKDSILKHLDIEIY